MSGTQVEVGGDAANEVNDADEEILRKVIDGGDASSDKHSPDDDEGEEEDDVTEDGEKEEDDTSGEKSEEQKAAELKRDKRRQQKERQRAAKARADREIADLRAEVIRLKGGQTEQTKIVDSITRQNMDNYARGLVAQFNKFKNDYQQAEKDIAQATTDGNGEALVNALAQRDAALEGARRVDAEAADLKKRMASSPPTRGEPSRADAPSPRQETRPVLDPSARRHAESFMNRNSWYDPSGNDTDTRIILAIDEQVAQEGYDPTTKDYWDEIESRASRYLPHRFNKGSVRKTPPTGGSGSAVTGKEFTFKLSKERVEAMKSAGVWDDEGKRAKYIAAYRKYDSQNSTR